MIVKAASGTCQATEIPGKARYHRAATPVLLLPANYLVFGARGASPER
jgi:hypothetical protein